MSEYYVGMTENREMSVTYNRIGLLPKSITVDAMDGLEPLRYVPERTCKRVDTKARSSFIDKFPGCSLCGHPLRIDWAYCPKCGARVEAGE